MDLNRVADNPLVAHSRGHYLECALLWDGYEFPVSPSNHYNSTPATVTSYLGEVVAFPCPGFNGYHALPSEVTGRNGTFLWCGVLMTLIGEMSHHYGTRLMVHELPLNLGDLFELGLHDNFFGLMLGITAVTVDKFIGLFDRKVYCHYIPEKEWISVTRYTRREFLFLCSFSPPSWSAIGGTLCGMAACLALDRLVRRQRFKLSWVKFVTHYIDLAIRLTGLLLGEAQQGIRKSYVFGLWLLASVVLGTCAAGSMRDLMSAAKQLSVPEGVYDLLHNPLFTNYIYMDGNSEASADDASDSDKATALYAARQLMKEQNRYIHIDGLACYSEGFSCLARIMINLFGIGRNIVFCLSAREVLVFRWVTELYRGSMINAIAEILYGGSHHGADQLQTVSGLLHKLEVDVLNHFHIGDEQDKNRPIFLPLGANVPREGGLLFEQVVNRFRGMGLVEHAFVSGDAKLAARYLEAADTRPSYAQLAVYDLTGALIIWAAVLAAAALGYYLEFLFSGSRF